MKNATSSTGLAILIIFGSLHVSASPPPFPDEMAYPNIVPPQAQFGTYGSAPGEFNEPTGVTVSHNDEIYVADTYNHRIQVFDADGHFHRQFGKLGNGPGELRAPQAVAADEANNIFVADTGNNRIVVYDANGNFLRSWSAYGAGEGQLSEPSGIGVGAGLVFVADTGNQRVEVFSKDGKFVRSFGSYGSGTGQFNSPNDVAVLPTGESFVVDSYNNRIQKFSPEGKPLLQWGDWGSYSGLMATPASATVHGAQLYVADLINHRVQVFDLVGNYLYQWGRHPVTGHEGNGRIHYPTRIAAAPSGKFTVVCEPFEHRCQVFSSMHVGSVSNVNDSAWWEKGSKFHYGTRAKSAQRLLTIAEPDTHAVLVFDLTEDVPQLLTVLGSQGKAVGNFVRPSGMVIDADAGRIFVSDGGNHRIQVFQLKKSTGTGNRFVKNQSSVVAVKSVLEIQKLSGAKVGEEDPRQPKQQLFSPVEPGAMERSKDGLLYVADAHNSRILVLKDDLSFVRAFGEHGSQAGQLLVPNDLAFSQSGDVLYIVDTYNFRIEAFDRSGKFLFSWGDPGIAPGQFIHPFGITAGRDGFVYVSDDAANRIQKFDEHGKYISSWGRWGTEPGQFYKPKGVTQDDRGRILVADFGNHRAQIMKPDGEFVAMFGIGAGYTPPAALASTEPRIRIERGNIESNGGSYAVDYSIIDGPITLNQSFAIKVRVLDAKTKKPREDIKLNVDANMPAHYHGMNTSPEIAKGSDGSWTVKGMLLHMPGFWKINFDVTEQDTTERAELDVRL